MGIIVAPIFLFCAIFWVWGIVTFVRDCIKSKFKLRYFLIGLGAAIVAIALATAVLVAIYFGEKTAATFDVFFSVLIGKPALMLVFVHYFLRMYARSALTHAETIRACAYGFRIALPFFGLFGFGYLIEDVMGVKLHY